MSTETLLEAVGVSKSYDGVHALAGVDWSIARGDLWGIVGPNGSGKTTFFNCLSGHQPVTAGEIRWRGTPITRLPMHRRARLGVVRTFQHAEVFGSLTVAENLSVAAGKGKVGGLIDLLGFSDQLDVPAAALSFGRRRQLGVAIAAARRPALLLLDEPTSGLNEAEAAELARSLRALNEAGTTLAIIDHHMDFLLPLVQRMLLLRAGEVHWEGVPAEFSTNERVRSIYLGTAVATG